MGVAPYTGAWIEMIMLTVQDLPRPVAPYTGAWIEISGQTMEKQKMTVAPYTGAWIEMILNQSQHTNEWSHPTRVRGLKLKMNGKISKKPCRTLHGCVD